MRSPLWVCSDVEEEPRMTGLTLDGRAVCRHCRVRKLARRKRGLCSGCHADPAVRDRYPLPERVARRVWCRHCEAKPGTRPRGLCWRCHEDVAVRELYPASESKYARRGTGIGNRPSLPASAPCPHPADSAGRIATLQRRAAAGEAMHHPGDNRAFAVEG